jgi:hypothetical protein
VTTYDENKRPKKLTVMIKPAYFEATKKQRRKCRKEMRGLIEMWLMEL